MTQTRPRRRPLTHQEKLALQERKPYFFSFRRIDCASEICALLKKFCSLILFDSCDGKHLRAASIMQAHSLQKFYAGACFCLLCPRAASLIFV